MELFFRDFGGRGRPLVILHGLFGSSNNWQRVATRLKRHARVLALDLRNHGRSPHAPSHTLRDMVQDLEDWLENADLEDPILLGHSMGGLAAMAFAVTRPSAVHGLIVVDVAPRAYAHDRSRELEVFQTDVSGYESREELDRALEPRIPEPDVRRFLLMNAERTDSGYRWRINVSALERSEFLTELPAFDGTFRGPALFVAGGASSYVRAEDHDLIRGRFPAARIETLPDAGHWLHYTAESAFVALVRDFLRREAS